MPGARGLSQKTLITDPQATLARTWVFMEGPRRTNFWQAVKSQQ